MLTLPQHFSWRNFQGQKYIFADYSYISIDILELRLSEGTIYLTLLDEPTTLLLVNVEGTPATKKFMELFLKASKECEPYFSKAATIGVNKAKILFIQVIKKIHNFDVHPFSNLELALNWLTQRNN